MIAGCRCRATLPREVRSRWLTAVIVWCPTGNKRCRASVSSIIAILLVRWLKGLINSIMISEWEIFSTCVIFRLSHNYQGYRYSQVCYPYRWKVVPGCSVGVIKGVWEIYLDTLVMVSISSPPQPCSRVANQYPPRVVSNLRDAGFESAVWFTIHITVFLSEKHRTRGWLNESSVLKYYVNTRK